MYPLTIGMLIQDRRLAAEVESVLCDLPVRNVMDENEVGDWTALLERVDALRPDVFILDVQKLPDAPENAVRRLRETHARPTVIVLDTEMDPQRILEFMRAGAGEYLCPPVAVGLQAALLKVSEELTRHQIRADDKSQVVGVFSAKGGCGGTTVCCHLAAELAQRTKEKVLLADWDLHGGLVGFLMRVQSDRSVLDLTRNLYRLDQSYWQGVVSNGLPGLSIIKAPEQPAGEPPTLDQLRQVLSFSRSLYPWTVLDLGSGVSPVISQMFDAIDQLFMVITPEITSLHRARRITRALLASGLEKGRLKVILNRAPGTPELTHEELEKMIGVPVFKSIPNDYPTLYDAYTERMLAPEKSRLRKEFGRLASKLAGIETTKKRFSLFG